MTTQDAINTVLRGRGTTLRSSLDFKEAALVIDRLDDDDYNEAMFEERCTMGMDTSPHNEEDLQEAKIRIAIDKVVRHMRPSSEKAAVHVHETRKHAAREAMRMISFLHKEDQDIIMRKIIAQVTERSVEEVVM